MRLKLVKKIKEAKGTMSFFWEPEREIQWFPGQYFYYTLPKLKFEDSRGPTRQFTIASSPTEGQILRLTTKFPEEMSGFKKTLLTFNTGDIVEGEGPSGMLKFNEDEKDKVHIFLAGGVGITPFRASIKYDIDKNLHTKIYLIYSNSQVPEIAYRRELESWAAKYDQLKLNITISEQIDRKWRGLIGRVNIDMVNKLIKTRKEDNLAFWAVGPPKFVYAMETIIDNFNIAPENKHIEIFTGY